MTGLQRLILVTMMEQKGKLEVATFGAGCFWCTEAVFQRLEGVDRVESGYTGGTVKNPTYKEICSGLTGHAEVVNITFHPDIITYEELLDVFWNTHDPTTLNRQGNDVGTQYRSAIFYHDDAQRQTANASLHALMKSKAYEKPIVTEIIPYSAFYKAEDYHQDYFNLHGNAPYCTFIVQPKVEKFKKTFGDRLRKNN